MRFPSSSMVLTLNFPTLHRTKWERVLLPTTPSQSPPHPLLILASSSPVAFLLSFRSASKPQQLSHNDEDFDSDCVEIKHELEENDSDCVVIKNELEDDDADELTDRASDYTSHSSEYEQDNICVAQGDEYHAFEGTAKEHWDPMRSYYQKKLWSMLEFMMPDLFTAKDVDMKKLLIGEDRDLIGHMKSILGPFILRRLKSDVMQQEVPKIQWLITRRRSVTNVHPAFSVAIALVVSAPLIRELAPFTEATLTASQIAVQEAAREA
ncbi:hypothetical protein D8674_024638 [Pyrus ussuriensis x Pyrus communis]|uniref:SNF2 N-terminal domain-containing protein n=1 Tax=Pyrus ussuriensis x Pyrus communis TaxID=2448454 RepID=A0A5N5H3G7_9ROSA|nr:hypothetical protein D8674_024638 [Pyrus ussuriensis x Pyrus communis]